MFEYMELRIMLIIDARYSQILLPIIEGIGVLRHYRHYGFLFITSMNFKKYSSRIL